MSDLNINKQIPLGGKEMGPLDISGYILDIKKQAEDILNSLGEEQIIDFNYSISGNTLIINNTGEINENNFKKRLFLTIKQAKEENSNLSSVSFGDNTNSNLKRYLNNIISENYPITEVSRLIPGQKIVCITFLGIKLINDNISKEFVDLFIEKLKNKLNGNIKNNTSNNKHYRVVKSNYKHLNFSIPNEENAIETIFGGIHNIDDLISEIFNEITDEEFKLSIKTASKNISKDEAKKIILREFNLGIGESNIAGKKGEELDLEEKLKAFYKAEVSSKEPIDKENIESSVYSYEKIIKYASNAIKLENEIIQEYRNEKFELDGINYDVIVTSNTGEVKINDLLLRYVRKLEDIIPDELKEKIEKYINILNHGFDFIAPIVGEVNDDFIDSVNSAISNLNTPLDLIKQNYKKSYSKEYLNSYSLGKKGMRVFIDIVDMGIMNLNDFREVAKKINSGEITTKDLITTGSTATQRFQNLINFIKYKYPNSKVSIGGDEVFVFIEGLDKKETTSVLKTINSGLGSNDIRGRVSYSFEKDDITVFDKLDSLTKLNKFFEKEIENIIHSSNQKVYISTPTSISLDISKDKQKSVENNIRSMLFLLKNFINKESIKGLLIGLENKTVVSKLSKYTISLEKNGNNINIIIN